MGEMMWELEDIALYHQVPTYLPVSKITLQGIPLACPSDIWREARTTFVKAFASWLAPFTLTPSPLSPVMPYTPPSYSLHWRRGFDVCHDPRRNFHSSHYS